MINEVSDKDVLNAKLDLIFINDEESLSKLIEIYVKKNERIVTYHQLINYFVPIRCSRKRLDNNLKTMVSHKILTKDFVYEKIIIYKLNEEE